MNERAKAEFMKIWTERVQRDYADAMLEWLERETDFFEAPASTKHHGAHPGGLVEHSLNVYRRLRQITVLETYGTTLAPELAEGVEETVAILGLLHDVCKVGVYHTETKRRKNQATGFWEDYQAYVFRDPLPLGHGEKSLYLIQRHMDLEPEEALAIRWHMGAYGFLMSQILETAQIDVDGIGSHTANALYQYRNRLQVIEEGTLNALAGSNAVPWFVAGDPTYARSIQVDYLNGQETPTIRRMEVAGQLGYVWDIWLDWGITAVDFRGIAKNPGTTITL